MAGFNGFGGGRGGFGGGNMQQLLKQAKQMQAEMEKAQQELEEMEIEGVSGSGLVKVVINGKKVLQSITIDPKAVDADDIEMTEDLIMAAFSDAYAKLDQIIAKNPLYSGGGAF